MNENEVIIVDGINNNDYKDLFNECVRYAIISIPFTIDRMNLNNKRQQITNIAKGKIAEALFKHFCLANNLNINFDRCETPFWNVDNRDFILNEAEWDIKNNFLYHAGNQFNDYHYIDLPALIPNRHPRDQWGNRNQNHFDDINDSFFLFSFMRNAELNNGQRGEPFFELLLSNDQNRFLCYLYDQYKGLPTETEPFSEDWFWEEMSNRGNMLFFNLNDHPYLVLTGYAGADQWDQFQDTGPFSNNNFINHIQPNWYQKVGRRNSVKFLDGVIWGTITNRTCPISLLPSFSSLYPNLRQNLQLGRFIGD